MIKSCILILLAIIAACPLHAQNKQSPDTTRTLQEVVVKAYEQNRQLKEVSAAINVINTDQLKRYNNTSLLPALNATPGVHMEERSPGSYRLNIRGSTLRSPFGVRNVKVYWNGIPFTDPGGNTYLNQLSFYNVNSIEVLKGPASSLYGAGTGGAVLINSQNNERPAGINLHYTTGSYNLQNINAQVTLGDSDHNNTFGYTHQTSDGYRDNTQMRRDVATWETLVKANDKQQLSASVLYGDLYYQTPGGLTAAQYKANPRAARPAAGAFPSAQDAHAAIYQKTFLAGINHQYRFNENFQNTTVVYGAFSNVKNPTFRNYERRSEPHFGGRTMFTLNKQWEQNSLQVSFGGEGQRGFFNTKTFRNVGGNPDTVQTDDDIDNYIYSGFVQGDLHLRGDWSVSAGVSINKSSITITRLTGPETGKLHATFNSEWAPRVAISKKVIPGLLLYASVSRGFSPPGTAEILPSTSIINPDLQAEHGLNYEVGLKSSWLQQRLYVEVNAFYYELRNAIVQRRDSSGADYFTNAGSTRQRGIESQLSYQLLPYKNRFINNARIWASHTYNNFRYQDFKVVATDYSGNKLPGVPKHTVAAGLDVSTRPGWYINLTWYYNDVLALNDANTDMASSYNLAGGRTGWRTGLSKTIMMDVFAGVDNLFDMTYSLGNDINVTGGRYYNAAPGRNYFGGVSFQYRF
ncbi:TonB-dependent receptor [Niastella koreensis]|uniref:TonB-dependent receptor n=3 Tax=Niastella koreensis TaxID=354356 RepID=G8TMP3_NIAKG|nr:TonB-dependent receptor [Niastella koreensis GR20-10]OQP55378.1 TonB-dependent receptor [Niastella koreensis]